MLLVGFRINRKVLSRIGQAFVPLSITDPTLQFHLITGRHRTQTLLPPKQVSVV